MLNHCCPVCRSWVSYDAVYGYGFCPKCGHQGLKAQRRNEPPRLSQEEVEYQHLERKRKLAEFEKMDNERNLPSLIAALDFLLYPCVNCNKMIDKNLIHFGNCPECGVHQEFEQACKKIDRCPRCFFEAPKCCYCKGSGTMEVFCEAGGLSRFFGAKGSMITKSCPHCINGKCGRCYGELDYNDDRQYQEQDGGWATRRPAFKTDFNPGKVSIDRSLQQQNDWVKLTMGPKNKFMLYNLVFHPNFDKRVPLDVVRKIKNQVSGLKFKMLYCMDEWTKMMNKLSQLESGR